MFPLYMYSYFMCRLSLRHMMLLYLHCTLELVGSTCTSKPILLFNPNKLQISVSVSSLSLLVYEVIVDERMVKGRF